MARHPYNDHQTKFYFAGLTENQERKIKILLERNQFLNEKPLIDKEFVTEADAEEIDEWIQLVKYENFSKHLPLFTAPFTVY